MIYIYSGETGSGKTTSLMQWLDRKNDAGGILSPAIDGLRYFVNISTDESVPMESDESDALEVGRFRFSRKAFEWAEQVVRRCMDDALTKIIVLDEIGPLELNGQGFASLVRDLLQINDKDLLLVIRRSRVSDAISYFNITSGYKIIYDLEQLDK